MNNPHSLDTLEVGQLILVELDQDAYVEGTIVEKRPDYYSSTSDRVLIETPSGARREIRVNTILDVK